MAGDGEQPGAGGRIASKPRQSPYGSQEGLLGQVVAAVLVDKGGAESPHLLVAGADERFEGVVVSCPGGIRQPSERVHRHHPKGQRTRPPVEWSALVMRFSGTRCRAGSTTRCEL